MLNIYVPVFLFYGRFVRCKIETELAVSLWRMKYMNGLRSKLARMLYIENCIIKSRRAVRENRWMKTVHIKVGSC